MMGGWGNRIRNWMQLFISWSSCDQVPGAWARAKWSVQVGNSEKECRDGRERLTRHVLIEDLFKPWWPLGCNMAVFYIWQKINWIDKASKNEETGSGKALFSPHISLSFYLCFCFVFHFSFNSSCSCIFDEAALLNFQNLCSTCGIETIVYLST